MAASSLKTFQPEETVLAAAQYMARQRETAILVSDVSFALKGIFTERDLLTRCVAERLDAATTPLDKVMTHDPDFVLAQTTPEEALVQMHRGHYRHLPVVEDDEKTIIGLHDILQVTYDAVLGDRANVESARNMKWRISHALKLYDQRSNFIFGDTVNAAATSAKRLTFNENDFVFSTVQQMTRRRISAVLVTNDAGLLTGIFTERDLLARVVVAGRCPDTTRLREVMTANPTTVTPTTAPLEALEMMLEGGYRHLPVVRGRKTMGMLDMLQLTNGAVAAATGRSAPSTPAAGMPSAPAPSSHHQPRAPPSPLGDDGLAPTQTSFDLGLHDPLAPPLQSSSLAPPASLVSYFFKFTFNGTVFRASSNGESYADLAAQVRSRIKARDCDGLAMSYLDDEADPIALASDAELADAVRLAEACEWKTIKLNVSVVEGAGVSIINQDDSLVSEAGGASNASSSTMGAGGAAMEANPKEVEGNGLVQASLFEKALEAFEASLSEVLSRPVAAPVADFTRLQIKLATVASILGNSARAQTAFEAVLAAAAATPGSVAADRLDAALTGLSEIYLEAGRYEDAARCLQDVSDHAGRQAALEKLTEEKDEICNDAASHWEAGEFAAAMAVYTNALRLASSLAAITGAPGDHKLLVARAGCYFQLEDYQMAVEDADAAIALAPEFVRAYLVKGKSMIKLARVDAARAAFKTGLLIAPDHEGILSEVRALDAKAKAKAEADAAQADADAAQAKANAAKAKADAVNSSSAGPTPPVDLAAQLSTLMALAAMSAAPVPLPVAAAPPAPAAMAPSIAAAPVPAPAPAPVASAPQQPTGDVASQLNALMAAMAMAPVPMTTSTPVEAPAPPMREPSPADDDLADTLQMLAAKSRLLAAQLEAQREQERYEQLQQSRRSATPAVPSAPSSMPTTPAGSSILSPANRSQPRHTAASLNDQLKAIISHAEEKIATPSPRRGRSATGSPTAGSPRPVATTESLAAQIQHITAMTSALYQSVPSQAAAAPAVASAAPASSASPSSLQRKIAAKSRGAPIAGSSRLGSPRVASKENYHGQ